eukprot:scaffold67887_cov66-Phaeocystis_antarctica.AAC.2
MRRTPPAAGMCRLPCTPRTPAPGAGRPGGRRRASRVRPYASPCTDAGDLKYALPTALQLSLRYLLICRGILSIQDTPRFTRGEAIKAYSISKQNEPLPPPKLRFLSRDTELTINASECPCGLYDREARARPPAAALDAVGEGSQ